MDGSMCFEIEASRVSPVTVQPTPEHIAAYYGLMDGGALLRQLVEQQLRRDAGLSYVQFRVLALLAGASGENLSMTALADGVVHSRSGLTYQADRLEGDGLIMRIPSATDERSVVVSLTHAGRTILEKVLPGHIDLVADKLFAPMNKLDVTAMANVLTKVCDNLSVATRRTPVRHRSGL